MPDKTCLEDAVTWDKEETKVSPQIIATVYSYMKSKYQEGECLDDFERVLGISKERISWALRSLEDHGYLMISRGTKPFLYRVVK